jgi:hypothetical protein
MSKIHMFPAVDSSATEMSPTRAALWIGAGMVTLACWLLLHLPSLLSKPPWFGAMTSLITFSLIDQIIHLHGPNGWVAGVVWWIGMLCLYLSVGTAIASSLKRRPRERDAAYAVLAWAALLSCLIALIFRVNIDV